MLPLYIEFKVFSSIELLLFVQNILVTCIIRYPFNRDKYELIIVRMALVNV